MAQRLFGRHLEKETEDAQRSFVAKSCARSIRQWLRVLHEVRTMSRDRPRSSEQTGEEASNIGKAIDMLVTTPEVSEVDPLFQKLDAVTEKLVACIERNTKLHDERAMGCADGPVHDFRRSIVAACQGRDLIYTLYDTGVEDRSLLRVNWEEEGACETQVNQFWQCVAPTAEFPRDGLEVKGLAMFETVSHEVKNRKTLMAKRN